MIMVHLGDTNIRRGNGWVSLQSWDKGKHPSKPWLFDQILPSEIGVSFCTNEWGEIHTIYIYIIQIYTIYIYKTQPWKTCRNIGPNKWHVKYCNWYEMHKGVTKKSMVPGTRLWWPPAQCSRWCPALPSWACPATIGCRAGGGKCCGCCSWIGLGNFSWNLHSLWFRRFFMFLRHQISTENDQENYRWVTTYTLYHFIRWHTFWIPNDLYICCKISG